MLSRLDMRKTMIPSEGLRIGLLNQSSRELKLRIRVADNASMLVVNIRQ